MREPIDPSKTLANTTTGAARASKTLLGVALVMTIVGAQACNMVPLSEQGERIEISTQERIANCKRVGHTTSKVLGSVIAIDRSETRLADELANLARNEAAGLGGDTIVPESEIEDGRRTFGVYKCIE